jgi:hypothetical protein
MNPFVIALAEAMNEVQEEYGIDDNGLGQLLCEALVVSPQFDWLVGNIWHDTDVTVKN